jgi:restriction endonuclease S subunit
MEKLPERLKSTRERIYRGELQAERMRDETVREVIECRKLIEQLDMEKESLLDHIAGDGLFLKDFFIDTYSELFGEKENTIEQGSTTEKEPKQYEPF